MPITLVSNDMLMVITVNMHSNHCMFFFINCSVSDQFVFKILNVKILSLFNKQTKNTTRNLLNSYRQPLYGEQFISTTGTVKTLQDFYSLAVWLSG